MIRSMMQTYVKGSVEAAALYQKREEGSDKLKEPCQKAEQTNRKKSFDGYKWGPLADASSFFDGETPANTEIRLGYLCMLSAKRKGVTDERFVLRYPRGNNKHHTGPDS